MTHFFIFLWISFIVTFTPGPSVIFTVSQSMRLGFWKSIPGLFGNLVASIGYGLISMSSVGYLLRSYPQILKWIALMGSAYLIIAGIKLFFQTKKSPRFSDTVEKDELQKHSSMKAFIDGFIVNLSNPKIMIFYLIVIPQFTTHSDTILLSLIALILIQNAMKAASLLFYSALANQARYFFSTTNDKVINQLSGIMIMILGLILMIDNFKININM